MTTRDGLPEHANYEDDGCDLHDRCMTCPLPACRYELPPGRAHKYMQALDAIPLFEAGLGIEETARRLGVSRRTGYRLFRVIKSGVLDSANIVQFP